VVGSEIDSCVGGGGLSYVYFEMWGFSVYVQAKKFMFPFSSCVGLSLCCCVFGLCGFQ
jgi:hypothetical protein